MAPVDSIEPVSRKMTLSDRECIDDIDARSSRFATRVP